MKKVLFVAAIAAFAFGATSCKKDYTCECSTTVNGETFTTSAEYKDVKKKDAEDSCEAANSAGGATTTCSLK